ncbi:hypothetical protein TSUD_227860 [Trifolium subterraneum]|uniref:Uncharacterized protein n=1 Tax=Trifolium subterraneum TaxID=3900 RepID=A0A2Z6MG44_TRISU|nr:hypothetical protein TSUD_227860 [Trifolium subterraneum]
MSCQHKKTQIEGANIEGTYESPVRGDVATPTPVFETSPRAHASETVEIPYRATSPQLINSPAKDDLWFLLPDKPVSAIADNYL